MPEKEDAKAIKARITGIFDLIAEGYDNPSQRYFPLCADYMMKLASPRPGEQVLDIATGTGLAAMAAAQAVSPDGRVQAIDLSQNMLDRAKRKTSEFALNNIDFHHMDAEQLEFHADYFDLISCAFGLFFLPDPEAALRKWFHVLKPGGRLIFTSFSRSTFQPMSGWFREEIEASGHPFPEPAWLRLAEPDLCQEMVERAGFCHARVTSKQMGYHLSSEHEWWEILWNSGFRGLLNLLSAQEMADMQRRHLEQVAGLKTGDGIWLDVEVHYTQAQKPVD